MRNVSDSCYLFTITLDDHVFENNNTNVEIIGFKSDVSIHGSYSDTTIRCGENSFAFSIINQSNFVTFSNISFLHCDNHAILIQDSNVLVMHSTFKSKNKHEKLAEKVDCSHQSAGGAIFVSSTTNSSHVVVHNCSFSDNRVLSYLIK